MAPAARLVGRLAGAAALAGLGVTAYAVADRCPHDGGRLSDGWLDGDRLVCARHAWEIEVCSGQCDRRSRDIVQVRRLVRSVQ